MFEINSDEVDKLVRYHRESIEQLTRKIVDYSVHSEKYRIINEDHNINYLTLLNYHVERLQKLALLKVRYDFDRAYWPGKEN